MTAAWPVVAACATALAVGCLLRPPRTVPPGAPPDAVTTAATAPWAPTSDPPWLRLVGTLAVGGGTLVLLGGTVGLVAGPVAAAICWVLTGRMEPASVRRRRARLVAAVPHAVDLMSACLAAGLSPPGALDEVAAAVDEPMRGELGAVSSRLRLGVDPSTVWRDLAAHPQLGGLGRSVARAVDSGASVSEALLRLSDDLRRRARADVEAQARAVGVKAAVPLGVCLLPAFVLVGVVPLVAGSLTVFTGSR